MNRKTIPSRKGFRVLLELDSSYGMTPSQLGVQMQVGSTRSSKVCKELLRLKLIEPNGIIDRFEEQLKPSDEGRRVLRLIQDWHNQGWWKRTFGPPPPDITNRP